jgi:hypothetical protein
MNSIYYKKYLKYKIKYLDFIGGEIDGKKIYDDIRQKFNIDNLNDDTIVKYDGNKIIVDNIYTVIFDDIEECYEKRKQIKIDTGLINRAETDEIFLNYIKELIKFIDDDNPSNNYEKITKYEEILNKKNMYGQMKDDYYKIKSLDKKLILKQKEYRKKELLDIHNKEEYYNNKNIINQKIKEQCLYNNVFFNNILIIYNNISYKNNFVEFHDNIFSLFKDHFNEIKKEREKQIIVKDIFSMSNYNFDYLINIINIYFKLFFIDDIIIIENKISKNDYTTYGHFSFHNDNNHNKRNINQLHYKYKQEIYHLKKINDNLIFVNNNYYKNTDKTLEKYLLFLETCLTIFNRGYNFISNKIDYINIDIISIKNINLQLNKLLENIEDETKKTKEYEEFLKYNNIDDETENVFKIAKYLFNYSSNNKLLDDTNESKLNKIIKEVSLTLDETKILYLEANEIIILSKEKYENINKIKLIVNKSIDDIKNINYKNATDVIKKKNEVNYKINEIYDIYIIIKEESKRVISIIGLLKKYINDINHINNKTNKVIGDLSKLYYTQINIFYIKLNYFNYIKQYFNNNNLEFTKQNYDIYKDTINIDFLNIDKKILKNLFLKEINLISYPFFDLENNYNLEIIKHNNYIDIINEWYKKNLYILIDNYNKYNNYITTSHVIKERQIRREKTFEFPLYQDEPISLNPINIRLPYSEYFTSHDQEYWQSHGLEYMQSQFPVHRRLPHYYQYGGESTWLLKDFLIIDNIKYLDNMKLIEQNGLLELIELMEIISEQKQETEIQEFIPINIRMREVTRIQTGLLTQSNLEKQRQLYMIQKMVKLEHIVNEWREE